MNLRLLIADNDSEMCPIYQQYFTAAGFEVATAADDAECMSQIERFQPDALVVERELPRDGGEGVLAMLCQKSPPQKIHVVMIADDPEAIEIQPPVIACLQKPFSLKALWDALQPRREQLYMAATRE